MKIYEAFNIVPNNKELYEEAFTHKSFCNENPSFKKHYERIEWLGDSILQNKVTKYIFGKNINHDEGMMTLIRKNAVGNKALCLFSKELGLIEFLRTGNSKDAKSEKLYADIFESFIGALYLDKQFDVIEVILQSTVYRLVDSTMKDPDLLKSPKTILQEKIQIDSLEKVIYFSKENNSLKKEAQFISQVKVGKIILGQGYGPTKQKAEVAAAKDALSKMRK